MIHPVAEGRDALSAAVLVDINVLLDVLTEDPKWFDWSAAALADAADRTRLVINQIVYPELSVGLFRVEELDAASRADRYDGESLPWDADLLAGKAYLAYSRQGGVRRSTLPDFYIGAHAAVEGYTLLTQDAARYRTYFPRLRIMRPTAPRPDRACERPTPPRTTVPPRYQCP